MNEHQGPIDHDNTDDRLAEIIEEITRELQAGNNPSDADLLARFPGFEIEIAEILPLIRGLANTSHALAEDDNLADDATEDCRTDECASPVPERIGDFDIIREIGRGGMGIVYEATQRTLGRKVALKTLLHVVSMDNRISRRFQNEVRAAAQLDHPNIVQIYAVGQDQGVHYYAMQLVDGSDLSKVIRAMRNSHIDTVTPAKSKTKADSNHRPHDPSNALESECAVQALYGAEAERSNRGSFQFARPIANIGIQTALALHHAHMTGIVHRDVKPSNLLLDSDGNARVADFGLAQIEGETALSRTGDVVGTLRYMSPEQACAKRVIVDHRTDIYSLGITLYELFTLEPAIKGSGRIELLRKIESEDPVSMRRINKRVPVEIETIVFKAISKNPDHRYQSAKDLAEDLERFIHQQPIRATPPTALDHIRKWCGRHKQIAISIAVMLLITFGMTVVGLGMIWNSLQATQTALAAEQQQRSENARLWRKAEGLRMATISELVRERNPAQSFAVAVEGHKLYPHRETANALIAAFESNHEHRSLSGHLGVVGTVSFNKTGEKLLTTASRTQYDLKPDPARIWNTTTGELLTELKLDHTITSAVFSPGGVRVLASSAPIPWLSNDIDGTNPRNHPTVWDSITGRKLLTLSDSYLLDVHASSFDPLGMRIVTPAINNTIRVWDAVEGKTILTLTGHAMPVTFAAFDPKGNHIVSISRDRSVRIWSARSGEQVAIIENWNNPERVPTVARFSPAGDLLATSSPVDGIQLWTSPDGSPLKTPLWPIQLALFSPDGQTIVGTDSLHTEIRSVKTGVNQQRLDGAFLAMSPQGDIVATSVSKDVVLWNTENGTKKGVLRGHETDVAVASFDPTSRMVATGAQDGTAKLWTRLSGAQRLEYDVGVLKPNPIVVENRQGTRIAVTQSVESRTQLVDLEGDRNVFDVQGRLSVRSAHSERFIITTPQLAIAYDLETGREIDRVSLPLPITDFLLSKVSVDGRRAILCRKERAWVWTIGDGQLEEVPGITGGINDADWSPNGAMCVTGSNDGLTQVRDARTLQVIHTLSQQHSVALVQFTPDSQRIVTTTFGNEIYVWNAATGERIVTVKTAGETPVDGIVVSSDGGRLFGYRDEVTSSNSSVTCWSTVSGEVIGTCPHVRGKINVSVGGKGERVAIASDVEGVFLWEPGADKRLLTDVPASNVHFLGENRLAVTTAGIREYPGAFELPIRSKFGVPSIEIWDLAERKRERRLNTPIGFRAKPSSVADGKRLLVSSQFFGASIFDLSGRHQVAKIRGHAAAISFLAFAGDQVVTTSWDGTAAVWDTKSGELKKRFVGTHPLTAASLSTDLKYLAVGDAVGQVESWELNGDETRLDWKSHRDLVSHVAFQPKSNDELLTSSLDRTTVLHRRDTMITQTIETDRIVAKDIRYFNDGRRWLFVPNKRIVHIGSMKEQIEEGHMSLPNDVNSNSVVVYGSGNERQKLELLDSPIAAFPRINTDEVVVIENLKISVFDASSGQIRKTIEMNEMPILAADLSPDGNLVVTGHEEHVSLWDLQSGEEILTIQNKRIGVTNSLPHFDPTGAFIIAMSNGKLCSYPIQLDRWIEQSPRALTPNEQKRNEILKEKDWPEL